MAQTVKLKRSAVSGNVPTTSDLALGEIAINTYDGNIFIKKNDGSESIVTFSAGGNAGSIEEDSFTGNGNTTAFTISTAPSTEENLLVFIDAAFQNRDSFTVSGTTVTFDTAPDNGSSVRIYHVIPGSVDDGILTVAKFAASAIVTEAEGISSNDNDTTLPTSAAVKDYVDTQVATVDTLPEVLANGNTTGGTDIAVSAADDITFTDSSKAIFGAGSDLQIYHDGSHSYIKENGTGNLFIDATSLRLRTGAGTENYLVAEGNGAVTLYYDNTSVLSTTADGISVTSEVEANEFIGDLRGAVLFKALAGEALSKGDVVYISGISGNTTVVSKADADDASKMPAFGIAAAAASANATVDIYTGGILGSLDTSSYSEGDALYVSTTAGALTATAPTGETAQIQKIAKVTRADASVGSIFITGAGRSNAVPNLDQDQFFLGNASNQAVATDFSDAVEALSINNVVEDTTPQLGGDLASNGNDILFADSDKAIFGAGSDLEIYHDGNDSYVKESGTGNLRIQASNLSLKNSSGGSNYIQAVTGGPVTIYYSGAPKLVTTSTGIDVTGEVQSDSLDVDGNGDISGNLTLGGYLAGPATFTIDPAAVGDNTGTVVIAGNLQVDGTTTTINSTTLTVDDKLITLASGSINAAAADGAGIEVDITGSTNPSITYDGTNDQWDFNKAIESTRVNTNTVNNVGNTANIIYRSSTNTIVGNNASALVVQDGGDVGIGTDAPNVKLVVSEASGDTALAINDDRSNVSDYTRIDFRHNNITGSQIKSQAIEDFSVSANRTSDLSFHTRNNGTIIEAMYIQEDGNVGIGETTPLVPLHISKDSASGENIAFLLDNNNTTAGNEIGMLFRSAVGSTNTDFQITGIANGANDMDLTFQSDGSTERVRFTADGKVGMGTTSPAGNLHIKSIGNVGDALLIVEADADNNVESDNPRIELRQDNNLVSGALYLEGNASQTATNSLQNGLVLDAKASSSDGGILQFATGGLAANQSGGPTNSAVRMTILRDGNVGIGETSPTLGLSVGNAKGVLFGPSTGASTYISPDHENTINGGYGLDTDTADVWINYRGYQNGTSRFRDFRVGDGKEGLVAFFDGSSGNVGIGTDNPSTKLHVYTAAGQDFKVDHGTANRTILSTDRGMIVKAGAGYSLDLDSGSTNGTIRFLDNGTAHSVFDASGKLGVNNTSPSSVFQVEEYGIDTTETSTTATTQVAIHTFAATTFRSARFTVQVTNSTDSTYHLTEILMIHDGTTPSITEYGTIFTGAAAEATFDADISSGNVRLLATPASTDTMEFKVVSHSITT